MDLKIQNLLFPDEERFETQWNLFYRGERLIYDAEEQALCIPRYRIVDFTTYLNAFSLNKWRRYTGLQSIKLHLILKGRCIVRLVGYSLDVHSPVKIVFKECKYCQEENGEIVLKYPEADDALISFEIAADSDCILSGGWYEGEFSLDSRREVNLSIATTTFRKEEFIQSNIKKLRELLESDDEIEEHLWIHVIDNGRTLESEHLNSARITIHPNNNVGGSGGFARGMIESIEQPDDITHVLLMDDDVVVLPESIRRLYYLLSVLKPEFDEYFVSGAMLCLEEMNIQHEDVGFVDHHGSYGPVKNRWNHNLLQDILECNQDYMERQNMYAGWWFCCVPMSAIRRNGLPLPLFIRGDDVEFSLRNRAKFITMNGICIWHMSFAYKFNAAMELYQVHRNSLILQAVSDVCKNVDFMGRMMRLIRERILSLDYNGAELILDAIEDFLKGPEFIKQNLGERLMREKSQKNEKMESLSKFSDLDIDLSAIYDEPSRTFLHKWLYRITFNGHRLCPDSCIREIPGIISYDLFYSAEHNFWHRKLLAVNSTMRTGSMRILNKERYRELRKREKSIMKQFEQQNDKITAEYRQSKAELTSVKFWKEYLEI